MGKESWGGGRFGAVDGSKLPGVSWGRKRRSATRSEFATDPLRSQPQTFRNTQ
ncbi:MAG: hypothetical protein Q4D16_20525 [Eubacteriales bacterium]|nr:hypothetical protein [Eubacteriales bacterium]